MAEPTDAMIQLAQNLIAFEGKKDTDSNAALRVIEKLRILLTRFSGSDGFTALMRRAVALSRSKDPALENRTLGQDGSITSFKGISDETGLRLTAQLLDLMNTFIGRSLTLSLLADYWTVDKRKVGRN